MNIYKIGIFFTMFFLSGIQNNLMAQDSVDISDYLGKKVKTYVKYNVVTPQEDKINPVMDSLINVTKTMNWETSFMSLDQKSIKLFRKLERVRFSMANESPFFDSDNPNNYVGVLADRTEYYMGFAGKKYLEIVPKSEIINFGRNYKMPYLYHLTDLDTTKFTSSIFLLCSLPKKNQADTSWTDSINTRKYHFVDSITVKSFYEGVLTLHFKTIQSLTENVLSKKKSSDNNDTINVFEKSVVADGYITVDSNTHFIYSIQATIERMMQSSVNDDRKKNITVVSKFTLYNSVE